jgi:methylmalonyl-CoA mutase cobalamin-binding domain/chain
LSLNLLKLGSARETMGRVVLATVEGDIHEIGKTLVGTMLSASGFEVTDLGVDQPADKIIGKASRSTHSIIGMSALLTTTMVRQREVIEELDKEGLRPRIKVMVGGAPITRDWFQKIKADGYSEDAVGAVKSRQGIGRQVRSVIRPLRAPFAMHILMHYVIAKSKKHAPRNDVGTQPEREERH